MNFLLSSVAGSQGSLHTFFVSLNFPCLSFMQVDGGALLGVDILQRPESVIAARHQKRRPYSTQKTSYNPSLRKLCGNVLFNWLVVIPFGLLILHYGCKTIPGIGVYVSRDLPGIREVVVKSILGVFMSDMCFFYSHWFLHTKFMYTRVHKIHHDFKVIHV